MKRCINSHQKLINTFIRNPFLPYLSCVTLTCRKGVDAIKLIPKRFYGVIIIGNVEITLFQIGNFPFDFEDGSMIALSEPRLEFLP